MSESNDKPQAPTALAAPDGSEFTGYDWEYTEEACPKCGETMVTQCCGRCGGEGTTGPGELYEEDPLWYDPDDYENCHECDGHGSWTWCRKCGWDETEQRYLNGKPENATPNTEWSDSRPC